MKNLKEALKQLKEETRGWSPQIGQTKGLTPKTLNKILMKIASGDDWEPDNEIEKKLKEAFLQLQEEKPGLWANIRAKRARGEKPAHKNSNAHKDAVKAGKRINAMNELSGEQREALIELQNILDQAAGLGDEAREIIRQSFPNMLSKGDAYGAFEFGSSANRYDTTLSSIIDEIEEYYDEE